MTALFFVLCTAIVTICLFLLGANGCVILSARKKILTLQQLEERQDSIPANCALILGAAVWPGNVPCPILEDRLLTGIALYKNGSANCLLMSGDHGRKGYDEVTVMKNFAVLHGVSPDHILLDPAGFTTYDSMYRADSIFQLDSILIVTQRYHLYRALFIAEKLGITAFGIAADRRRYRKRLYREVREILARGKYLLLSWSKPAPR